MQRNMDMDPDMLLHVSRTPGISWLFWTAARRRCTRVPPCELGGQGISLVREVGDSRGAAGGGPSGALA